ncbi:MAG: hypothetical protein F6K39_40390 [Okeania sp. SIO3B3]|nr:hypothetical protein [Okeania sp. SIO3B3]
MKVAISGGIAHANRNNPISNYYYWTIDKSNINKCENQRSLLSQNLSKMS